MVDWEPAQFDHPLGNVIPRPRIWHLVLDYYCVLYRRPILFSQNPLGNRRCVSTRACERRLNSRSRSRREAGTLLVKQWHGYGAT